MRVSLCFVPTMPNVGSRYSQFSFEKKTTTAFGFEKSKNCWGRIFGFHLSDKKNCIYDLWTLDYGGGVWGRHSDFSMVSVCLPFWKPVRLDWNWGIILECSWTYRNNAILYFDFNICQSEQFTMAIRLIFTHLIQMITDIHISTEFINENIRIQCKCIYLYFKCVLQISLFHIK